jgi:single-strand DNA-binding protein
MENYVNVVVVQGGVVKDPELNFTSDGLAVTSFPIANSSIGYRNGEKVQEVSYFDVSAFGKLAEICCSFLKKGKRVIISGKIKQSRWKTTEGQSRSKIRIIAQDVKFLPYKAAAKAR